MRNVSTLLGKGDRMSVQCACMCDTVSKGQGVRTKIF